MKYKLIIDKNAQEEIIAPATKASAVKEKMPMQTSLTVKADRSKLLCKTK